MTSREEIAARLRASGNWLDGKDTSSMREAMYLIDLNVKAPQGREFSLLFNRLAGLIDPTCKLVEADSSIVCSECAADLYDDDLYCLHCGARVVRDDG